MNELNSMGERARAAAAFLSVAPASLKNSALKAMADSLINNAEYIIEQNRLDIMTAKSKGVRQAMLDRLSLDEKRIADMAEGIMQITALPDPVGETVSGTVRPNGLNILKRRVPIGVIGIIYEARPNVTSDAAALCIKSGNAAFLRGGSEAINSNRAIVEVMKRAASESGLPEGVIELVTDTSRQIAAEMMRLNKYIDVLIPRGGAGLIKNVVENSTVPVIETGSGNCHVYVAEGADLEMAKNIVINAKVSRPSVCNAIETLLVDSAVAEEFLPVIAKSLADNNVEIRGCERTQGLCGGVLPATEEDWATEYNDYIIAVRVVDGIDEAIAHIAKYGTRHSEAIITEKYALAEKFLNNVDAAAVYVNASTRFTDGNEFGFGAEIGISTQKIHARGPMGLRELTTVKYVIYGNGQIR